jgi:hypothetical protein
MAAASGGGVADGLSEVVVWAATEADGIAHHVRIAARTRKKRAVFMNEIVLFLPTVGYTLNTSYGKVKYLKSLR